MTAVRCLLVAVLLGLLLTPAAHAQTYSVTLEVSPRDGVDMGEAHTLAGRLTRNGVPMAREPVIVEAQRFPFEAPFAPLATVVTDVDGRFLLRRRFDRNHDVRAFVPALGLTGRRVAAYTFPRSALSYRVLRAGVVRLTHAYRTPRDVLLTQPTQFYLGPRDARTAPLRGRAATRRIAPGRFVARRDVRVPEDYEGRFRYASCFAYDPDAGMGDPRARCPARAFRFATQSP